MSGARYPTARTGARWQPVGPYVPEPRPGGRPARYPRRGVADAVLDRARDGRAWRALPHDRPPCRTASHDFRARQQGGTRDRAHATPRAEVRRAAGGKPEPSAAPGASQAVQGAGCGGPDGYAGGEEGGRPQAVRGR